MFNNEFLATEKGGMPMPPSKPSMHQIKLITMKKMPLFFASVMLIAIMSAFTLTKTDPVYYQNESGEFIEKTGPGNCDFDPTINCEYVWTGLGDPNDPNDPQNYSASGLAQRIFVPTHP
jgi:hypothetical protein